MSSSIGHVSFIFYFYTLCNFLNDIGSPLIHYHLPIPELLYALLGYKWFPVCFFSFQSCIVGIPTLASDCVTLLILNFFSSCNIPDKTSKLTLHFI